MHSASDSVIIITGNKYKNMIFLCSVVLKLSGHNDVNVLNEILSDIEEFSSYMIISDDSEFI